MKYLAKIILWVAGASLSFHFKLTNAIIKELERKENADN
jgi:hypothetical protein